MVKELAMPRFHSLLVNIKRIKNLTMDITEQIEQGQSNKIRLLARNVWNYCQKYRTKVKNLIVIV